MNALFRTRVTAVARVSPGFVRVTVADPRLHGFRSFGRDQRVKIVVPGDAEPFPGHASGDPVPEPEWRARWRALPPAARPALRTYTVAAARPGELDLDFFVHTSPGPASGSAQRAAVGETLLVSGPTVDSGPRGVQWAPEAARRVLIAGDEAAVPAIRGILATLGPEVRARVVVAVEDPADALLDPGVGVEIELVDDLLAALAGERAAAYAWVSAETSLVAEARRVLAQVPRVQAQGYWTTGPRAD